MHDSSDASYSDAGDSSDAGDASDAGDSSDAIVMLVIAVMSPQTSRIIKRLLYKERLDAASNVKERLDANTSIQSFFTL